MVQPKNDILKNLGIHGEDSQWMLATAPEFFNWLQEYISEENILTHAEIKEYEELKRAGKLHTDSELEQKLQEIECENPGLSECKENELIISKKKLKKLRKMKAKQTQVLEELDVIEKTQKIKLDKIQLHLADLEKESKSLTEKTVEVSQELQTVERENCELYQDLQKIVITPKVFTHQMPFYEHFNFIAEFIKQLEQYCEKNQVFTAVPVVDQNNDTKLVELQVTKDGLVNARYQEIMDEMKIAAMESVSNTINSGSVQLPTDKDQLILMMMEYGSANEQNESQLLNLKKRLNERISEMVLAQIELLSTKNMKFKHARALNRIENINQLKPFVNQTIQISEIIWFAINLDWQRLNKDFSCDDFGMMQAMYMRNQVMKRLLKGESMPRYLKTAQDQVVQTIIEAVGLMSGDGVDVKDVIHAFLEFEKDLSAAVASVSQGVASHAIKKSLFELKSTEKVFEKFVYGGTTSKPQLGDQRFTKKIFKICAKNKDFQRQYTEMKSECKRIGDNFAKNKYFRYSQALWIWFLTEPMKVLEAIKEAHNASDQSIVHLSGIRRQN